MAHMAKAARRRLVTVDDLSRPGSPYDLGELWDGVWYVHEATKGLPGPVATRLSQLLLEHIGDRRLGWVTDSSQGYHLRKNPDRLLCPDVAFVSRARLGKFPRDGWIPVAPDLAIEIVSKSDRWSAVLAKAGIWIAHGTRVAWVVDPWKRRAAVLRDDFGAEDVGPDGTLDASPVLPGLKIPLAEVLKGLD